MTAEEECEALTAHAKALFSGEAYDPPELLPLPPEWFFSRGLELRCQAPQQS